MVFDFIRPNEARQILDMRIESIIRHLASEKQISLSLSPSARETLLARALDNLDNGGRGIGNAVESCLINPLARYLFDNGISENASVKIESIDVEAVPVSITCTVA